MIRKLIVVAAALSLSSRAFAAESCTTQSALGAADRTAIADTARTLALAVQTNDVNSLKAGVTPEIQKSFGALQYMAAVTSPKLAGGALQVEQVYVLDGSSLKLNPDGSAPEGQFFCSLNKSMQEVDFVIPGLPPGRYAFAMVRIGPPAAPWQLSMLLREQTGRWLLAGFYPKPLTLAGHDGLWYWKQAREYARQKETWNAWLFYQAAQTLLRPADFVLSSHLDKLNTETNGATPAALSAGISAETPLVLKGPPAVVTTGATAAATTASDLRFTSLSLGEPAGGVGAPVLEAHVQGEPASAPGNDPAATRTRNLAAARALLAAYPELRKPFQTIAMTTDAAGQPPAATALAISEIH